jgi:hypothetical protein
MEKKLALAPKTVRVVWAPGFVATFLMKRARRT